jgi:HEAT repeat protein
MDGANSIIDQLLKYQTDGERAPLIQDFEQLPPDEKQAVESRLIQILNDEQVDDVARAWIPTFLGLVGTPNAYRALMERLPVEKEDLVRRWLVKCLVRHFTGDERIDLIIRQFQNEQINHNRRVFVRMLAQSRSPLIIPLMTQLLDHFDEHLRGLAAWGLGLVQARQAVQPLIHRLALEEELAVSHDIVAALVAIGTSDAVSALVALLRDRKKPTQLHVAAAQALGQLATHESKDGIQVLLETVTHPDRVVALTATDALLQLLPRDDAAVRLANFGLRHTDVAALPRVADALRLVGGLAAIDHLRAVRGDPEQEQRAQTLLEQIGGRQALNVLVQRRVDTLTQASNRVAKFDDEALTIFQDTINQAKRGFVTSLRMSTIIFGIGVVLLGFSLYLILRPDPSQFQQLFGVGGGLAGLGTILTMFYRGPLERIERSVTNLVQIEIAFLAYIRQVTQISAMFEREYLDNDDFGIPELKSLLDYTEHTLKETMPLVHQFTLSPASGKQDQGKETEDTQS